MAADTTSPTTVGKGDSISFPDKAEELDNPKLTWTFYEGDPRNRVSIAPENTVFEADRAIVVWNFRGFDKERITLVLNASTSARRISKQYLLRRDVQGAEVNVGVTPDRSTPIGTLKVTLR